MDSRIFTSEPMATRALAAEIRHDSTSFTRLLEMRLGRNEGSLGVLRSVQCEAIERLDLLLTYGGEDASITIGIEAKFDHEFTGEQIRRQADVVEHLVLICVNGEDASDVVGPVDGVLTWHETLDCFPGSRLTSADIDGFPLTKRMVERRLERIGRPRLTFDAAWDTRIQRGGSGMPSIVIRSPTLADGRQLRGQIQVMGRGRIASIDEIRFEYHIGIQVNADDDDLPSAADVDQPPGWIRHLCILDTLLGRDAHVNISKTRARNGRTPQGMNKLPLVEKFMGKDKSWLAKGYTDGWALGIKSVPTPASGLADLCDSAAEIFKAWYGEVSRTVESRTGRPGAPI